MKNSIIHHWWKCQQKIYDRRMTPKNEGETTTKHFTEDWDGQAPTVHNTKYIHNTKSLTATYRYLE